MINTDIAHLRLYNQLISRQTFTKPVEVVDWLGAVQAQDYAAAKWAIGLRLPGVTGDEIEQAFTNGALLRTHLMRPTWHLVPPATIRWMLMLTAPRVLAGLAHWFQKLELDPATLARCHDILRKTLQGGKQLTRSELATTLQESGIATDNNLRSTHIFMHAELDGVICSGARRGKQFTYALLDERSPLVGALSRDEALATLTRSYFTSHGPATVQDFIWWSGLSSADARAGLAMVNSHLHKESFAGREVWLAAPPADTTISALPVYLLPNYDEYIVGYTDRSAVFDEVHLSKLDSRANILFNHTIVLRGQIVGTWKPTLNKRIVTLTTQLFVPLDQDEAQALHAAMQRYAAFLSLTVSA